MKEGNFECFRDQRVKIIISRYGKWKLRVLKTYSFVKTSQTFVRLYERYDEMEETVLAASIA